MTDFAPTLGTTTELLVVAGGGSAQFSSVTIPATIATACRIRSDLSSSSSVCWSLSSTSPATLPIVPVLSSASGSGAVVGNEVIEPGHEEVYSLGGAEQTALAAGTLKLSAVCSGLGRSRIYFTAGTLVGGAGGAGGGGDASATNQVAGNASLATIATAGGAPADTAWTGSGSGSIIATLKAVYAAIATATAPTAAGSPAAASRVVSALASTGTQTSVASSATDVTVLAANASRLGFSVFNDSTATLYLLLAAGTSSATNHSVQIGPSSLFETSTYAGIAKGIWSAANGSARVTEFS